MEIKPITAIKINDKEKFTLQKNFKDKCDNFVKNVGDGNIIKSHDDFIEIIKKYKHTRIELLFS